MANLPKINKENFSYIVISKKVNNFICQKYTGTNKAQLTEKFDSWFSKNCFELKI